VPSKVESKCTNIFKNADVETQKKELAKILSNIINTQLKTKKPS
jgi:phenylpyruvate tautomerase PptA (4-oxalocrotonate tautomerase family)